MKVILSLDENLVKVARKIALDRETTLTGLVREYLEKLAADTATNGRKTREREALERSFEKYSFTVPKNAWTRADLNERQ
jgi:hypothetical protein